MSNDLTIPSVVCSLALNSWVTIQTVHTPGEKKKEEEKKGSAKRADKRKEKTIDK